MFFAKPKKSLSPIGKLVDLDSSRDLDLGREAPHREVVIGGLILGGIVLLFIIWGVFAHLDAGVYAKGDVVVAGNRQEVQHRDGGIVSTLNVREGDRVQAGQVLLSLNADELKANARAAFDEIVEQKALEARLIAELNHAKAVNFPSDFSTYGGEDAEVARQAMQLQRLEFERRNDAQESSRRELLSQIAQSAAETQGYDREIEANRKQNTLVQQEMGSIQGLYHAGLVPASRMRSLERSQAQIEGDEGSESASRAKTNEQIGEKRIRISGLTIDRDAEDVKDYRAAELQLSNLVPKLVSLNQQIDRTIVRAPATGQVVDLKVFTVGGVITAGQKIMDIVPSGAPIVVEAQVPPADADDLRVGQPAEIRITAFHDRRLPKLQGVVSKVSADSFKDDRTGTSYFKIEVTVPPSQIELIRQIRGADFGVKPGLNAEVLVPLRSRSALDYLTDPLTRILWQSFRER